MPPEIDQEKCTGCGSCREVCTEDVFFGDPRRRDAPVPEVTYPDACVHCNLCVEACPSEAMWLRTPLVMHVPYK